MNGIIHRHILFGDTLNRQNILMILGILLCAYFSYHVLQGQRSLTGLMVLHHKIEEKGQLNEKLAMERVKLQEKVKMMRPGTLDRDLLEERIQLVLGYTQKDDYVISNP